jgi:hypothetical protein
LFRAVEDLDETVEPFDAPGKRRLSVSRLFFDNIHMRKEIESKDMEKTQSCFGFVLNFTKRIVISRLTYIM